MAAIFLSSFQKAFSSAKLDLRPEILIALWTSSDVWRLGLAIGRPIGSMLNNSTAALTVGDRPGVGYMSRTVWRYCPKGRVGASRIGKEMS